MTIRVNPCFNLENSERAVKEFKIEDEDLGNHERVNSFEDIDQKKNARKKDGRDWTAVKTNTRKLGDELSCQSQKTVRAINVIQILQ